MIIRSCCLPIIWIGVFAMHVSLAQDSELLVVDETPHICGDISILQLSSLGAVRKEFAKNICSFNINDNGYFILKNNKQEWFKGNIDSHLQERVQKIVAPSEKEQPSYATISNDGKQIAWVIGFDKTVLVIEKYEGDESSSLLKISSDGIILMPSWSPDSKLLAFYEGPLSAVVKDGYSLKILNVDNPSGIPIAIAPPSLITRLTPMRSDPILWAPDGRHLLFEASYKYDDPLSVVRYVVAVDGSDLRPSPNGTWDQESKSIQKIERENDDIVMTKTYVLQDIQNGLKRAKKNINISGRPLTIAISPSADRVAYFGNDKEIYIYDTINDRSVPFGQIKLPTGRLKFIHPGER
jgi:hypothetical protein